MKTNKLILFLFLSLLMVGLFAAGRSAEQQVVAQTTASRVTLIEDFANGSFPPALNLWNFNHNFTLGTAWDLGGSTINEPLSQSSPYALTLYAGNEDRVTFNQPSSFSYVSEARVWGWTLPASESLPAGRGRVVFEGTGDTKTFNFYGGAAQWQLFAAMATDTGDNGNPLGEIIAVRLADSGNNGNHVMFDDLEADSVTPPTRSNLTLTMTGSTTNVNVGDTLTYDLTVTNSGPQNAPNVTIADTLPFGGTFLAGSSSSACHLSLGRVVCDLGTLTVNSTRTVTIAVQVGNDACATFTNRATVTAQALDSNMADNTAVHTATTPLPACADYQIMLTGQPIPVDTDEIFTYILAVRNNGPDTTGGSLTANWPSEIFVIDVLPDNGITCSNHDPLACTIGPLVSGQQKQIAVTVRTSVFATGLLEATAQVMPNIDDPQLDNNSTRLRFVVGTPYTYTLIAEAGVGALANYAEVEGVVMNEHGEVAFWAKNRNTPAQDDLAIFVGDGTTLTQRFTHTDLPTLADPLIYRHSFCLSFNDNGWTTFLTLVYDPDLPQNHFENKLIGNSLYLVAPNGDLVLLDSLTKADDGLYYHRYGPPVLNNANRVLAYYNTPYSNQPSGIIQFQAGQQTEIYQTNDRLNGVGLNDNGDYAVKEFVSGLLRNSYRLLLNQQTSTGLFTQDILQHDSIVNAGSIMDINIRRQLPYSQKHVDLNTGTVYESFYLGGIQPIMRRIALGSSTDAGAYFILDGGMNDNGRYVVEGQGWGPNRRKSGLFIGPHYLAHRVVKFSFTAGSGIGTPMFGSTAYIDKVSCYPSINNAGQVAFAVRLRDGREVVVRAEPTRDNDGDGVTDYDELGAANSGDGNGDGIPDSVQPNVAAVPNAVDGMNVTFTTDPNFTLTNVQAIPNPSPGDAPNDPFWFGHFAFEITDVPVGGAAMVDVTLPWGGVRSWWKYGPTPDNAAPHWYDFTFNGTTGAEINGNVVTLHFVDGGRGDSDRSANGVIVDPGGPTGFPYALFLPAVLR
ncbi:MAG: DUF11 domain-containing protein [Chloroflexi bacterium]|nr:DUF11 domain-containing protein [Chloroflexota bacterium]